MSSSSTSAAATVTALLAITTPFVLPSDCPRFTSINVDTSIEGVAAVLVADDVPSCFPDGWADVVPESRMYFNPGVCPSGWVYHDMGNGEASDKFRAYCCDSGFDYLSFNHSELVTKDIFNACGRWTSRLDSGFGSDASNMTSDNAAGSTLLAHKAWSIAWYSSDISSLTPQPPSITNDMLVPTWTPGEVIPDGKYDLSPNGDNVNYFLPENVQWFLMIGMPIIGALMIGSCVFCCVRSSKKKRRARRAEAATAAAAQGGLGAS
ncbi:hypothetical protein ACHAQA_006045 [Verticillium albo-atrum]